MLPEAIQGKYIIGKQSVVGDPRRKYEDRVFVGEIVRNQAPNLLVAIVADGVGSADFGSRGAQLAIDTAVKLITGSNEENIPLLMERVVQQVNQTVYEENSVESIDGLTTLTMAIIFKDRCYIANVGDSRAYWIRSGKLLQLSRDHTYYNIYGGDPRNESADVIVNVIGKKPEVQVDLGFYLNPDVQGAEASQLGIEGLPLSPGDSILVCSDGLTKSNNKHEPYITEAEIIEALNTELTPNQAAIKLVSTAEGRRPDDNVSAVTIQYISKDLLAARNKRTFLEKIRTNFIWPFIYSVFLVLVGFLISRLAIYPPTKEPTLVSENFPTNTPASILDAGNKIVISPLENSVGSGYIIDKDQKRNFVFGANEISQGTQVEITDGTVSISISNAELFVPAGSLFSFKRLKGEVKLSLQRGAILVKHSDGMLLSIESPTSVTAQVSNAVMGFSLSDSKTFVDCYKGDCVLTSGVIDFIKMRDQYQYLEVSETIPYSTSPNDRCIFWKDLFGADTISSMGILGCTQSPINVIETPTQKFP